MAFASDSTTAPARPLLPLSALDRRAIGRNGWARARARVLAAQLGGEIRDHVAEGMRQAWAAARGLLQAAASASAPNDASALASESVAAASAFERPAQSRSVDQIGNPDLVPSYPDHIGVVPLLLPLSAPLPSLTAALSRRRAIFGAVAVDEPDTAAEARAIHARRELHSALEWGFAYLDAFDLGPAALDVVDDAIARMDAMDGDTDREPYLAGYYNGAADPTGEGEDDSDEIEGAALESHGLGFVRAGEDDLEDDVLDDDRDPEPVAWAFGPSRREVAHV